MTSLPRNRWGLPRCKYVLYSTYLTEEHPDPYTLGRYLLAMSGAANILSTNVVSIQTSKFLIKK